MAETSASGSDPASRRDGLQPATRPSALSDSGGFVRTGKAVAELGRDLVEFGWALRDDLSRASRPATKMLRALGGAAVQRLRDLDFSATKLSAAGLAERSIAVWSRVGRRRPHMADIESAKGNQRRWRKLLLRSVMAAGAASLMFVVGLFAWALSDVPWEEIADGTLKPVVVLETSNGKPLVKQGPIQGPYATREDFSRHLIDAVLTAEDRRFYDHSGIDLKGISRALYRNVGAGEVIQGGSTITQQLIKIFSIWSGTAPGSGKSRRQSSHSGWNGNWAKTKF